MTARKRPIIPPRWETPDPPGVTGSYGPRVIEWSKRELGLTFGAWQAHAITKALRHRRNGDLIARTVLLSTARQNGKTVIVRGVLGWFLAEGQKLPPFAGWSEMLAAAHDAPQARIAYNYVRRDVENNAALRARTRTTQWAGIRAGNLDFDTVTGQPGSARGKSAGLIAWDEMLTQRDWDMWEALGPTQSAQRSPLMLLTSTAGHADSVVLRAFYDRLKRQASGAEAADPTFYGAWWESEDDGAALDWDQIAQANPGLGDGRLTKQAILTDYSILPADGWRRERLNHFIDTTADSAISPTTWAACRTTAPLDGLSGPFALGVDIQPGWERATICAAGMRADGRIGVEVYRDLRSEEGNPITAERVIAELHAFPDPVSKVAYDLVSGASAALGRDGEATWLPYDPLKPGAVMSACMDVNEMILARRLAVDDPLLDAQVPHVARRNIGQDGGFVYNRLASTGPVDAFMAMTFAAHAIAYAPAMPKIT